ncbi:hypothetical protein ABPG74_002356 [Tetrahymena malaccensis]
MNRNIIFLFLLLVLLIQQIKCRYKHNYEERKNKRFRSQDIDKRQSNTTSSYQEYFEHYQNRDDEKVDQEFKNLKNYTNQTQKVSIDKLFKQNKFHFKNYHEDEDDSNQKQCHYSCEQCNQRQCLVCKDQNQQVNFNNRACQCLEGFYMSQLHPLVCKPITEDKVSTKCDNEIQLTAKNFEIKIFSKFQKENQLDINQEQDFIIQDIIFNTEHSQFNIDNCRDSLQFQYLIRKSSTENLLNFQSQNLELNNSQKLILIQDIPGLRYSSTRIKIPVQVLLNISMVQKKNNEDLTQRNKILFELNILNSKKIVRTHRWFLNIYIQGDIVQTFTQDVYQQPFQHCKQLQKCIILQDYDIYGLQYQSDWKTYRETNSYFKGDYVYLRIWFKDSTNTKKLSLQNLYSKTKNGQIFDSTTEVDQSETFWEKDDRSLHIKFKIAQLYSTTLIQINMQIQDINQVDDKSQAKNQQYDQFQQQQDDLQQIDKEKQFQDSQQQQFSQQEQDKELQQQSQQKLNQQEQLYFESIFYQFQIRVND